MMKTTIDHDLLLAAGYARWKKETDVDHYQKCVKDEIGKKYYINAKMIDFSTNDKEMGKWWDFDVQLDTPLGSVHIQTVQWFNHSGYYSGRTIAEVEAYFETLFQFHGQPYYER